MYETLLVVLWILVTLGIASAAGVLGRRYGVEYPIALLAGLVVIAAILANKLVTFLSMTVPAGVIVMSSTYLITDYLAEKWGREVAHKAVWAGFCALVTLVVTLEMAIRWPAAPFALERAEQFASVLSLTPRITIASIAAYLLSQHHDIWAFHYWKERCEGKHLWLRNNASTIVSQFIDSVIFTTIAFYGTFPIGWMIVEMWLIKALIALLDTPFIYLVVWLVDRIDNQLERAAGLTSRRSVVANTDIPEYQ